MKKDYLNIIEKTYRGKKVLVTGHTGFKGSWLVVWLNSIGAEVLGYSLLPETDKNLYDNIKERIKYQSIIGDIRDEKKFTEVLLDFEPDFVFHLAAQPLVRKSYESPIDTYQTNVIGTGILMTALRSLESACTVVIITTDKVYHNNEWHYPYRENDRLGGFDPYSSSKACVEILVESFRNSFFHISKYNDHQKAIATARAGNVIGGGDWSEDRIIPDIYRSLAIGQPVSVRNPSAVRPWQHVLEPLGGYLLLGAALHEEFDHYSQSWNFGPLMSDHLTVKELVDLAIKYWGNGKMTLPNQGDQLHEAGLLKLDISKSTEELDWYPLLNSSEAIQKTIEWYKGFDSGIDPVSLIMKDLEYFKSKA